MTATESGMVTSAFPGTFTWAAGAFGAAVFGAAILSFVDAVRAGIDWHCVPAYLVGTAAAIFTGVVSIHLMRYISRKKRFGGFAYYCWVIGVLLIILHLIF